MERVNLDLPSLALVCSSRVDTFWLILFGLSLYQIELVKNKRKNQLLISARLTNQKASVTHYHLCLFLFDVLLYENLLRPFRKKKFRDLSSFT